MQREQSALRTGMMVLVCALAIRLIGVVAPPIAKFLAKPENASFLVFLETGRVIKPTITPSHTEPAETTPPETIQVSTEPTKTEEEPLQFFPEDAELIQIRNTSGAQVDLETLLLTPWQMNAVPESPLVLIVHSHGTESYTQTEAAPYTPSGDFRTLDSANNMLRVGEALKKALEARGISVIHDRTLHDYPSYNDAYSNSRKSVTDYLKEYPSLCIVIDLHRDATDTAAEQLKTAITIRGDEYARLMLVIGTNRTGGGNSWQDNMALAVKLQVRLEQKYPGICRPISLRKERFNQDLSTGALLIEVGSAGDTLEQALSAAEALADCLGEILLKKCSTS